MQAADKKKDSLGLLASPDGVTDLFALMGMKKFNIMDKPGEATEPEPDLGASLLGSKDHKVTVTFTPAGNDGVRLSIQISNAGNAPAEVA